jgi:hypothetical protein
LCELVRCPEEHVESAHAAVYNAALLHVLVVAQAGDMLSVSVSLKPTTDMMHRLAKYLVAPPAPVAADLGAAVAALLLLLTQAGDTLSVSVSLKPTTDMMHRLAKYLVAPPAASSAAAGAEDGAAAAAADSAAAEGADVNVSNEAEVRRLVH